MPRRQPAHLPIALSPIKAATAMGLSYARFKSGAIDTGFVIVRRSPNGRNMVLIDDCITYIKTTWPHVIQKGFPHAQD